MASLNELSQTSTEMEEGDAGNLESDHPEWIKKLLEFYEFGGEQKRTVKDGDIVRIRKSYTLNCRLCKEITPAQDTKVAKKKEDSGILQGNSAWTFVRHLQRVHKGNYNEGTLNELSKKTSLKRKDDDDEVTIVTSVIGVTGSASRSDKPVNKYDSRGSKQQEFNKHVHDFIALDGVPLSVSEGQGFQQLIKSIDNRLTCPSKSSNSRLLAKQHAQITKGLTTTLGKLKMGSAHLLLDIWSSKSRESVIGVMVRYIHDWNLYQHCLAFKHFPGTHDGARIKKTIEDMLKESYGLNMYNFLTVTADNASSILAAFRDLELKQPPSSDVSTENVPEEMDSVLENDPTSGPSNPSLDHDDELLDVGYDPAEIVQDFVTNDQIDEAIDTVITDWLKCDHTNVRKTRNSCLAHLLQLGINDALKYPQIAAFIKKVNTIVKWFHKSNKFHTELKELSGLGLIKPCDTRWNSLYHCLKRFSREVSIKEGTGNLKVQIIVLANKVLQEAKSTTRKVPPGLSDEDISVLNILVNLLKPFSDLTDLYQGDGVTSSCVILGFVDKMKALDEVQVPASENDEEDEEVSFITSFKENLKQSVLQRFDTDHGEAHKVIGRKIVTTDIFNDPFYILSTILDPRSKTVPFEDDFASGLTIRNKYPTKEKATQILKKAFIDESFNSTGVEVLTEIQRSPLSPQTSLSQTQNQPNNEVPLMGTSSQNQSSPRPPQKKKKTSIFSRVQLHQAAKSSKEKVADEIEEYLGSPPISEDQNPLRYWRLNDERFPILASLAARYLSLPATSASVERLFSVGGSIMRARRASMKIETAERLILYNEYLREGKGKPKKA